MKSSISGTTWQGNDPERLARARVVRYLVLLGLALFSIAAFGQEYPARPVRLIVPFAAGGGNDTVARVIAQRLSASYGQQVYVDNRPGAGGTLGAEAAAKSPPDGYTLFLGGVASLALNPNLHARLTYDALKDFAPIVLIASAPLVLVVNPAVPAKTIQEFAALARAQPGKLNYASNGNGSSAHLAAVMYESMAGVQMVHVPYKGLAPALTDLLSGEVQLMFSSMVAILPHIKAGKLRALATTGAKRDPALPDLPTIAEAGIPGYESGVWFGLMVAAGTPKEIIAKLNAAAVQATKSPEFVKRMTDLGYNIIPGTPEDMVAMNKAEIARWTPIVKASGAKVD
jgi:tripartite-type tricarboxylate transporter receptor subunit TctC